MTAVAERSALFEPLDWEKLTANGLPEVAWLDPPYLPRNARVWVAGPTESAKSMWAMYKAARLSREGKRVVYFSEENPLAEDVRRLKLLGPDWENFVFYSQGGLDLNNPEHIAEILAVCTEQATSLLVLDTLSACWSGKENDNDEIKALDRLLVQIIAATGVTILVLDHTGHVNAFVLRRGVSALRGASAKGQKADVVLEFVPKVEHRFLIRHGKNRLGGGTKEPDRMFQVCDVRGIEGDGSEDNPPTLDIREVMMDAADILAEQEKKEIADRVVSIIEAEPGLATRELRKRSRLDSVMWGVVERALGSEQPARVVMRVGKRNAHLWYPAMQDAEPEPEPKPRYTAQWHGDGKLKTEKVKA